MKKKGFTLVEIIVVITIIAFIGTVSFFGIRLVNKNMKITKLEEIEDKIFQAVSVYIETNDEARNNLYKSKNGVYVPLNVLENEGLIDFQDIKITDKDYVITMLGSEDETGACIDTTTIGSWDDGNKTIYLCTTASGATNISTVGFAGNNLSLTSKNRVWFYGSPSASEGISADTEAKANNYVMYNKKGPYKIYYIDRDDSLALVSYESFGNTFDGNTQKVSTDERYLGCSAPSKVITASTGGGEDNKNAYSWLAKDTKKESEGQVPIGIIELTKTKMLLDSFISRCTDCSNNYDFSMSNSDMCSEYRKDYITGYRLGLKNNDHMFKIQLKPCMKISGGNGTIEVPYQITNYCG